MSLLTVEGLEAGYGQIQVLWGVEFTIGEAEILGILGHNGMGKSTLLKALIGEIGTQKGKITFRGMDVGSAPTHRRARAGMGYVPQGRQIFPNLTVRENLHMAVLGTGASPEIVDETLERFPRLQAIIERPGGVLSGGEQQILALARCLCGKPKLILLDEPTEGIQPSIRDEIVETLLRLRQELGLAILLVEQNVKFMGSLADRMLRMEKGRLASADCASVKPRDAQELSK
jgi:urea ABC transporter ATP-binding protein UrtE